MWEDPAQGGRQHSLGRGGRNSTKNHAFIALCTWYDMTSCFRFLSALPHMKWLRVASSSCLNFSIVMGCNLELCPKINSPLSFLLLEYFNDKNRNETRTELVLRKWGCCHNMSDHKPWDYLLKVWDFRLEKLLKASSRAQWAVSVGVWKRQKGERPVSQARAFHSVC